MSTAQPAHFTCPLCGWTIKSPYGKQDIESCIACHNQKHHNKSLRMTKAELLDTVAAKTKPVKK